MRRLVGMSALVAGAVSGLVACAAPAKDSGISTAVNRTSEGLDDAAMAPLTDLNLRRTAIPAKLEAIVSPYEPLPQVTCATIAAEVVELTTILGADSDAPPPPQASLNQRAGEGAADLALGGVASAATDFIPFRSIVREATGASAHERRLRAAYERGVTRRAYLKGVGAQIGCAPPAAPEPGAGLAKPGPPIEYRSNVQPDD
ncbi:MAG TPA: hypothetical protein VIA80_14260 [Hyphomonadaceae bacterium]